MKLITFEVPTRLGRRRRLGAWVEGDRIVDLNFTYALYLADRKGYANVYSQADALLPPDMLQFFERGEFAREAAETALEYIGKDDATGAQGEQIIYQVNQVKLLAPFPRPASLRDFGVFKTHMDAAAKITGKEISPEWFKLPNYYRGSTSPASIAGHEAVVTWPNYTNKLDFELEWGVYISKEGRNISIEDAPNFIAGFTIFNDISARDIQFRHMTMALGPAKGKDFDNSNIMGPCLVTPDEIEDPYNLRMTARVNGEVWADGSTSDMYYTFAEMISFVSQSETLSIGDFFGSGTVGKGCGWELGRWIQPGDVIELEVEKIGVLRNRIGEKEVNTAAWREKG
jgi:2-keto-4-pentenoate hydratase/2-oxohepta-3-ene-1,7-dioic acid hydratase in catechol pathway